MFGVGGVWGGSGVGFVWRWKEGSLEWGLRTQAADHSECVHPIGTTPGEGVKPPKPWMLVHHICVDSSLIGEHLCQVLLLLMYQVCIALLDADTC